MKKFINLIFMAVTIISIPSHAQDSARVIILSESVGLVVDNEERSYYDILPNFKENFISAKYYLTADSNYYCLVKFDNGKAVQDTILKLSYNTIKNTAYRIQYLESVVTGKSNTNTILKFANNEEVKNIIKAKESSVTIRNETNQKSDELTLINAQKTDSLEVSGKKVIIMTKDQKKIDGELIKVDDSTLVVSKAQYPENLIELKDSLVNINLSEIDRVTIINESQVLSSMGYGFLFGAGVGALLGFASGDDDGSFISFSAEAKALMLGGTLGLAGAVIGLAVGAGTSTDEEILINSIDDLKYLDKFSKHGAQMKKKKNYYIKPIIEKDIIAPEIIFDKKFEISVFLATTSSGPASGIEDQMNEYGFNKTSYSSWFGGESINYPKSYTGFGQIGSPWMISLKYYYTKELLFGAFYSGNPIGMTSGYYSNGNSGYLDVNYSVYTIAAMSWYKYHNLSIGLGPAIFLTNAYKDDAFGENGNYEKTKIGLVAEAGLTYPAHSVFFVSALVQYRFVGEAKIGPFGAGYKANRTTLPPFTINYNHLFVGFGAGIRI